MSWLAWLLVGLVAWVLVSIPLGLLVARAIAQPSRPRTGLVTLADYEELALAA